MERGKKKYSVIGTYRTSIETKFSSSLSAVRFNCSVFNLQLLLTSTGKGKFSVFRKSIFGKTSYDQPMAVESTPRALDKRARSIDFKLRFKRVRDNRKAAETKVHSKIKIPCSTFVRDPKVVPIK